MIRKTSDNNINGKNARRSSFAIMYTENASCLAKAAAATNVVSHNPGQGQRSFFNFHFNSL